MKTFQFLINKVSLVVRRETDTSVTVLHHINTHLVEHRPVNQVPQLRSFRHLR